MSDLSSIANSEGLGSGAAADSGPSQARLTLEPQTGFERFGDWFSDRCSSILVKETRQALKSRQFIWTYFLLLLCVGVWTLLGLSVIGSALNYNVGPELLLGYWVILGFPLGLIIPFSAYRSMAGEFEDGTINLISITTMKPYQIVMGKFGSAMLQMLTYLAILAPCIMFTYLLRGISLRQILFGTGMCVGGSICLTIVGLFLASAIRNRALSIGVSVLFVLLLGWIYFLWCIVSEEMASSSGGLPSSREFNIFIFAFISFFGSFAALLLVAAISQISFPADNRATAIRITMLIQQILFVASVAALMALTRIGDKDYYAGTIFVLGHYWLVMGLLMIGENEGMSRRARRKLPQALDARSNFSLFMPGSGRGFLFAIANLWACSVMLALVWYFRENLLKATGIDQQAVGRVFAVAGGQQQVASSVYQALLMNCVYISWFLSIGYLLVRFLFKPGRMPAAANAGPLASLILGLMPVILISIASVVLHYNLVKTGARNQTSIWMISNWYWAIPDIVSGKSYFSFKSLVVCFSIFASVFIGWAMIVASRELLQIRIEVPKRLKLELETKEKANRGETIDDIFGELPPRGED